MTHIRISDAAQFLGVSDDTVRRWIASNVLAAVTDPNGRMAVDGTVLAKFAKAQAKAIPDSSSSASSARNRFVGLVTAVKTDTIMAQVELQCGPFRVVSLMSCESVRDLELKPGAVAVAVIKSTNVVVETLEGAS